MSISANVVLKIAATETLTGDFVSPSDATVTVDQLSTNATYTGATTVPVTKQAAYEVPLSSGAVTINFAALTGLTAEEVVVATGLKLQAVKFRNKATNANKITLTKGASNGYGLAADGSTWTMPLSPGMEFIVLGVDANPDVAAGARTIDVTGTGSQILEMHLIFG